jgi:hypothetical protein
MLLSLLVALAVFPPAQDLATLPPGCTVKTFHVATPAGWFATNLQDPPEGREGCLYIRYDEKKSPTAVMEIESISEALPLLQAGDAFETLAGKIAGGLEANMNVVLERETFRNDNLARAASSSVDRAAMRVYDAKVPGDPRPHTVALALLHVPGRYVTLFSVTPAGDGDRKTVEASKSAFRDVLNGLSFEK